MFTSVLVKFVGKLCNLLNLSPSLLLWWPLVLWGAGDKQLIHISRRSLYERIYIVTLFFTFSVSYYSYYYLFMFIDPTYKTMFAFPFPIVLVAIHNIKNGECESHAYPG
jgi:hypothetical protein